MSAPVKPRWNTDRDQDCAWLAGPGQGRCTLSLLRKLEPFGRQNAAPEHFPRGFHEAMRAVHGQARNSRSVRQAAGRYFEVTS